MISMEEIASLKLTEQSRPRVIALSFGPRLRFTDVPCRKVRTLKEKHRIGLGRPRTTKLKTPKENYRRTLYAVKVQLGFIFMGIYCIQTK